MAESLGGRGEDDDDDDEEEDDEEEESGFVLVFALVGCRFLRPAVGTRSRDACMFVLEVLLGLLMLLFMLLLMLLLLLAI